MISVFNTLIAAKLYDFIAFDMKNASFRKLQIAQTILQNTLMSNELKLQIKAKALFTLNIKIGFFN